MATTKELAEYIGKTGILRVSKNLGMPVVVLDVREVYGRLDVLVGPSEERYGIGKEWVSVEGRITWAS